MLTHELTVVEPGQIEVTQTDLDDPSGIPMKY